MLKASRNRIERSPEQFLSTLKAGEHGCIFCSSREVMQNIQFAFVKSGLENNWGAVYATATQPVEEVRSAMRRYGIDTYRYEESNGDMTSLLIVKGEDLYNKDPEHPDLEIWKKTTKSICDDFIAKGKRGVRVAADLSSYFLSRGLERQWFDLEYALERKLSMPLSILCAYDMDMPKLWNTDILKYYVNLNDENKEFVDAHSFAIFASKHKSIIFTI
jgi:hypothetical protein